MIYFDVTKTGAARHRSGLMRVSARLREELGANARSVVWKEGGWSLAENPRERAPFGSQDWLLTPELFSEPERPGFWRFLHEPRCRLAAIFHDAIPLKLPHITWPQSVGRHPEYLKMLARFNRVFAVSQASQTELIEFWNWQGAQPKGAVQTIALGADFLRGERPNHVVGSQLHDGPAVLLCVGIVEPRKNQALLADVAESLLAEGVKFELHVVGRVNSEFGEPIARRLRELAKRFPGAVQHHVDLDDSRVEALWRRAHASVFPTIAEGCGLPLIESLWMGVPCVCSDLPVLRENGDGGGVEFVAVNDRTAWTSALRRVITEPSQLKNLRKQAAARVVPEWRQTAEQIREALKG